MTSPGKRFMMWLIEEKEFKNIGEFLVLPIEKRLELRLEFFKKEEDKQYYYQ